MADSSTKPAGGANKELPTPDREVVYKKTPQRELKMYFFLPGGWKATDKRPGIVFFFGGGWTNGKASQFFPQCHYLASRGMVAASAEYRVKAIDGVTPDVCVEDARSAVRFVRKHATEYGIDGQKLLAGGGSAGGHLAAATALCPGPDSKDDDLGVSCKPAALVLFNPVLDLGDERTMAGFAGKMAISPMAYLTKGCPPMIAFFGTDDGTWLPQGIRFLEKSAGLGNRVELWMAAGQQHAFFNRDNWRAVTIIKADEFLVSLGYLTGQPTMKPIDNATKLDKRKLPEK